MLRCRSSLLVRNQLDVDTECAVGVKRSPVSRCQSHVVLRGNRPHEGVVDRSARDTRLVELGERRRPLCSADRKRVAGKFVRARHERPPLARGARAMAAG